MARKILHIDLDAFFCAVEEQHNPSLLGKAFAVGGRPDERGVVASCSYPARRFGVHSAMPMVRALRLCPGLVVVPSRHGVYRQVSEQIMDRLTQLTPLIEQVSIDEAFLDVTGLPDASETIARNLQSRIRGELNLPCSLGAASNKLVAKIANDVGKAAARGSGPPNAITIVPPGQEAAFLAPLPVEALWGVGPRTSERLAELGIRTIGALAAWPAADLERRFGKTGQDLAQRARGLDDREIVTAHSIKSISQETTFARDIRDPEALRHTLRELSEGVGKHLREAQLVGSTVKLKIRWPDFTTITRQLTLEPPTDQDARLYEAVLQLFEKTWPHGQAVRLLGVGAGNLGPPVRQLSLWETLPGTEDPSKTGLFPAESERARRLQAAVDALRERFGDQILKRGDTLGTTHD